MAVKKPGRVLIFTLNKVCGFRGPSHGLERGLTPPPEIERGWVVPHRQNRWGTTQPRKTLILPVIFLGESDEIGR